MDPFVSFLIFIVVYDIIGIAVAKVLYPRRHGVSIKIINGKWDALPAVPIILFWPLFLLVPSLRRPELCRHPDHIMERDAMRSRYEQFQAAAARDERYR